MARVLLTQPSGGTVEPNAAAAFWMATHGAHRCTRVLPESTAMTLTFNTAWAALLNALERPDPPEYFAMIHADVATEAGWLDRMIGALGENHILSHVIPFRDRGGLTSTGLLLEDISPGPHGRKFRRLTTREAFDAQLPEIFDVRHMSRRFDASHDCATLLVNTGLWVARCGPWMYEVRFRVEDGIRREKAHPDEEPTWTANFWGEDWCLSEDARALGLRVAATTMLPIVHGGIPLAPHGKPEDEWHLR